MAHATLKASTPAIEIPVTELEEHLASGYELVTKLGPNGTAAASVKPTDLQWNRAGTHLIVRTARVWKGQSSREHGLIKGNLVFDRCGSAVVC